MGLNKSTGNLGATDEEVMDSLREDVIAAFKICNQQRARIATLESEVAAKPKQYEFLDEDFLELMNDIGRLGHEKFGTQAFEVAGSKRQIPRHQKDAILYHARGHITNYLLGIKHDTLGTTQGHLAAAAFNNMLEFIFSQDEKAHFRAQAAHESPGQPWKE
jgi:hypothetical protein